MRVRQLSCPARQPLPVLLVIPADYGAFQDAARGRIDLARIERWWEDILRIIGSIHTGAVRAYDVTRMLSRDMRPRYSRISPTPLTRGWAAGSSTIRSRTPVQLGPVAGVISSRHGAR